MYFLWHYLLKKRNQIMKQLLLLFMLMVVCACSREEDISLEQSSTEKCSVDFTPATIDIPATKSSATYLPQGSAVKIAAYTATQTTESTNYIKTKLYSISDASGSLTATDGARMELFSNSTYMFYEYSPALNFKEGSTKTINVENGTDFLLDSLKITLGTASTQNITLPAMDHKCSYVDFTAKLATTNVKITTLAIGDKGLTLTGITHSPLGYTLGRGFSLAGVALDGSCNAPKSAFTTTVANTYVGGGALLPKAEATFGLNMNVLVNGTNCNATATLPKMAFTAGNKYQFTLVFTDAKIVLALTVTPWNNITSTTDMGSGSGTIIVGSWDLKSFSTGNIGDGSVSFSVVNWTPGSFSTGNMGTGSGTIIAGGWTPGPFSTGDMGTGSATVVAGGWTPLPYSTDDMGIGSGTVPVGGWDSNPYSTGDMGL
jgi:hypothetical protein